LASSGRCLANAGKATVPKAPPQSNHFVFMKNKMLIEANNAPQKEGFNTAQTYRCLMKNSSDE
jgi:hypothetical protein